MRVTSEFGQLAPADKAALIYAQAQGDMTARLWRAALGSDVDDDTAGRHDAESGGQRCDHFNLDALLALLAPKTTSNGGAAIDDVPRTSSAAIDQPVAGPAAAAAVSAGPVAGLGPNATFGSAIEAAAARTGLPAAALAAIVDAEAGKTCDGKWNTASRNPRSSAAGLGQFLAGTWQGEAERAGTWLHGVASRQGWLGDNGRILPGARAALLALRYDGTASINATADYAARSIAQLKNAGIALTDDVANIARAAYLGHHLGTGDAIRFLKGGLDSNRARVLLDAQIGNASASRRIAAVGDAASAHRTWLLDYVARHVTPGRFAA